MADETQPKPAEQVDLPAAPPLPPPMPTFSLTRAKEADASQAELTESRVTESGQKTTEGQ